MSTDKQLPNGLSLDDIKSLILETVKENLTVNVSVDSDWDYYSSGFRVEVEICLEGEKIASDYSTFTLRNN